MSEARRFRRRAFLMGGEALRGRPGVFFAVGMLKRWEGQGLSFCLTQKPTPKRPQNDPETTPKRPRNDPETTPKRPRNDPEMTPK